MTFSTYYLFFNAILCLGFGISMYFKPKALVALVHNASLSGESLAIMSGWGSALVGIGYMSFSMARSNNAFARKIAYGSLTCMWAALFHGTWVMSGNSYFGNWNNTFLIAQMAATGIMFALGAIMALTPIREKVH